LEQWMTGDEGRESSGVLAEYRLGRSGLVVKLDKGFASGTYVAYVEFDDLDGRVGFAAARRAAGEYAARLQRELSLLPEYATGAIEDPSRTDDPRRKRDLEMTFLSFPIETGDSRFHDQAMKASFRVAYLRAGQGWDQDQARAQTHRRHTRQEQFRQQLGRLLDSEAYAAVDAVTKARLLSEVPPLAFPARSIQP
jgi:hypothetical protein